MIELLFAAVFSQEAVDCRSPSTVPEVTACIAHDPDVRQFQAELVEQGINCEAADNTRDMNTCVGFDLARETARMNLYFNVASRRADEQDREPAFQPEDRTHAAAWLTASQSVWKAYAETACDGVFDQWKAGTIRTVMVLDCWIDLTRERTHVIWRHHLTYMDSTPSVLPEPALAVRAGAAAAN